MFQYILHEEKSHRLTQFIFQKDISTGLFTLIDLVKN